MKTVMKKIFSLMLVAVLLVSAVPFAASAEETIPLALTPGEEYTVNAAFVAAHYTGSGTPTAYYVHNGGLMGETFTAIAERDYFLIIEEFAAVPQLCATCGKAVHEGTCCATCKEQGHTAAAHCKDCGNVVCTCIDVTCEECGKVECECCEVCHKATCICDDEKPVAHTVRFSVDGNDNFWYLNVLNGYTVKNPGISYQTDWTYLKQVDSTGNRVFMGWSIYKDAADGDGLDVVAECPVYGPITYYAIFKDDITVAPPTGSNGGITNKDNTNKVYLHVYLNGNAGTIALTKEITDSYLLDDDKISNGEIWSYLANNYYTAKDSKGMLIDGLYVNTGTSGTFPQQYYPDNNQPELDNIEELRSQGHVHIAVMLKNAVVKSSYSNSNTADSSNPKTGDMILAPVAVLGLSASALAVLFFLNKKRAY